MTVAFMPVGVFTDIIRMVVRDFRGGPYRLLRMVGVLTSHAALPVATIPVLLNLNSFFFGTAQRFLDLFLGCLLRAIIHTSSRHNSAA